jgi:predicted nucleic acid-binding protein
MDKLKTLSYLFDSRFLVAAITMPHNSIVVTENDIEAVNKTAAKATANFSYTSS